MSDPNDAAVSTHVPAAWRVGYLWQQIVTLGIAGLAMLMATWGSPVYAAIWSRTPDLFIPPGIVLPVAFAAPLLAPIALGLPTVWTRHRAPLLLWIALMVAACVVAVIEVSRLNWVSFVAGVAFRIESGPVPLVRTLGGLAVVLSGFALLAHQSVHLTVLHLAERGVEPAELARTRSGLLSLERVVLLGAAAAGGLLVLVTAVSMGATEGAPDPTGNIVIPLVWTTALSALLLAAWASAAWRRRSEAAPAPFGSPAADLQKNGRARRRSPSQRS